jgi:hypothetical protein
LKNLNANEVEIFIYTMLGCLNPRTIRVKATINNQIIIVLVDTRSTYNFIGVEISIITNFFSKGCYSRLNFKV